MDAKRRGRIGKVTAGSNDHDRGVHGLINVNVSLAVVVVVTAALYFVK